MKKEVFFLLIILILLLMLFPILSYSQDIQINYYGLGNMILNNQLEDYTYFYDNNNEYLDYNISINNIDFNLFYEMAIKDLLNTSYNTSGFAICMTFGGLTLTLTGVLVYLIKSKDDGLSICYIGFIPLLIGSILLFQN